MNAMPPDPAFRATDWRERWLARLEATPPWLIEWLRQQHDGPYWRPGSLAPDYDAIEAAILNVGGWMDAYVDAAMRMQARCTAPSRTIVGNWVHGWPSSANPGPNRRRAPRGRPVLRPLAEGHRRTAPTRSRRSPGSNASTPSRSRSRSRFPGAGGRPPRTRIRPSSSGPGGSPEAPCRSPGRWPADGEPTGDGVDRYRHRPTVGTRAALSWGAGGPPNGLARDLRPDEALRPDVHLRAARRRPSRSWACPRVVLHLAVSAPVATAVVRLTDVAPGRDVGAGDGRDPQPDPPALARRSGAARPGLGRGGRSSTCGRPVIAGCPATGSESRSPRRPGPSSGRRHSRPSSSCTAAPPHRRASSCRSSRPPAGRAT